MVMELDRLVRQTLINPARVYRGIRDGDERGYCYVDRPRERYVTGTGRRVNPDPNHVFCVFVTEDWIVTHWEWIQSEREAPFAPENSETRFTGGLIHARD